MVEGMKAAWAILMIGLAGFLPAGACADEFDTARAKLLNEIVVDARRTGNHTGRPRFTERTMRAMAAVPRHLFVPPAERGRAYANRPLPIGYGQTISQPYIVALMTDLLDLEGGETVLEIGTGSAYQAAVLAQAGARVYTIEIIGPLADQARNRLAELGYDKVTVRSGDGYFGWPDVAPFDGILITAAASHIPPPLIKQLRPGGRMVIPVGPRFMTQQLVLVEKDATGAVTTRQLLPVAFVPLTGGH